MTDMNACVSSKGVLKTVCVCMCMCMKVHKQKEMWKTVQDLVIVVIREKTLFLKS